MLTITVMSILLINLISSIIYHNTAALRWTEQ